MRLVAMKVILFLAVLAVASIANATVVQLIIDTDIGQDFDDTFALAYALSRPDVFNIRLVLTSTHNTTARATLVAKILTALNRTEVPVGAGISDTHYIDSQDAGEQRLLHGVGAQWPWVGNFTLADFQGTYFGDGVGHAETLLETEATAATPWFVVGLAPLTNLADIFHRKPHLKQRVVFSTMGGAVFRGYSGRPPAGWEYNVGYNSSASQMVYNTTGAVPFFADICAAPLDTSFFFQIYGANYQFLLSAEAVSRTVHVVLENYRTWFEHGGGYEMYRRFNPSNASSTLYDLQAMFQAAVIASRPGFTCDVIPFVTMSRFPIAVTKRGAVDHNATGVAPVFEAVSWLGGERHGTYPLGTHVVAVLASAP